MSWSYRSCRYAPSAVFLAATLTAALTAPPLGMQSPAYAADNQERDCPSLATVEGPLQRWETVAALPTARTDIAATTGCDGRIYALGGQTTAAGGAGASPTGTATASPTGTPTGTPTGSPTGTPTGSPTGTPTGSPTGTPTGTSTVAPAGMQTTPTGTPTTGTPTASPTGTPTGRPTGTPTASPTAGAGTVVGAMDIFDPKSGKWVSGPDMPTPRSGVAAATDDDGKIYAIGGRTGATSGWTDKVEVFSPDDGRWTSAASLPKAMNNPAATRGADGRIYVLDQQTLAIYDPDDDRWTTADPPPSATYGPALAALSDGRILAIGGTEGAGSQQASNEVYAFKPGSDSPEKGSWSKVASLPAGVADAAAATGPDDRVYLTGGRQGNSPANKTMVYSPDSDSWSGGPQMPNSRAGHASTTGGDGRVYVLGGTGQNQKPLDSVDALTE